MKSFSKNSYQPAPIVVEILDKAVNGPSSPPKRPSPPRDRRQPAYQQHPVPYPALNIWSASPFPTGQVNEMYGGIPNMATPAVTTVFEPYFQFTPLLWNAMTWKANDFFDKTRPHYNL